MKYGVVVVPSARLQRPAFLGSAKTIGDGKRAEADQAALRSMYCEVSLIIHGRGEP
jgi:fructose-1,6-bisphosphatase/sedoheptulose 1,7-bisphosphatase-like protein